MPTYQELAAQLAAAEQPTWDLTMGMSGDELLRAMQARLAGTDGPQQSTGGTWGGPLGVEEPHLDPITGLMAGDNSLYGYFDPRNAQANTDHSVAMQEALARGDTLAYQQALEAYRANSGGLQPVWSYNIAPESVAANARNPGGVNADYVYPQNIPYTGPTLPSGIVRDQAGALTTPTALSAAAPTTQPSASTGSLGGELAANRQGSQGGLDSLRGMPREAAGPTTTRSPGSRDARATADRAESSPTLAGSGRNLTLNRGAGGPPTIPPTRGLGGGQIGVGLPDGRAGGSQGTTPVARPPLGRLGGSVIPPVDPPTNPFPPRPEPPTNVPPRPPGGGPPGSGVGPPVVNPGGGVAPPGGGGNPYVPPTGPRVTYPPGSFARTAFPNWSTWNEGSPYLGGDPGMMATSQANRSVDYGNLFQHQFGGAYSDARALEDAYRQTSDTAYSDLYDNPGFNSSESDLILNGGIPGGPSSLRASAGDLDNNFLTSGEQADIRGNPRSVYDAFDPNALNDIARAGTGATQGFFDRNYQSAQNAVNSGQSRADNFVDQYGTGARGALSQMNADLGAAIDPAKLGIGDAEVQRMRNSAGRSIGAQYGAAMDQMQRQAEAAGNVSPLALAASRERLLRSQSIDMANAQNAAELQARGAQREAERDISNRRIQAGTTVGQAGIGLEGDIANTGLNANQSMAALRSGTEATYGNLGTNLGLNATRALTDAANTAGQTRIGQAEYVDTNASRRATDLAANRQNTQAANLNTRYTQGMGVADANARNATAVGQQRIAGQQAARNYWAGANQFQGGQANAAAGQQISGAQTSLSGQGQAGSVGVGNLNARRNPITIGGIGFTL